MLVVYYCIERKKQKQKIKRKTKGLTEIFSEQVKREICDFGRRMYGRGYTAANDGNISVRLDERIIITPAGVSKGYMTPEMMVIIDLDGNHIEGERRASSETKMHLQVYKEDDGVKAVVHAHPPFATSFAVAGQALDQKIMPETVIRLGTVPVASYGTPSTDEIPESIKGLIKNNAALLLEHHGALTWGETLQDAYFKMETLEFYAQVLTITHAISGQKELSDENIDTLMRTFKLN